MSNNVNANFGMSISDGGRSTTTVLDTKKLINVRGGAEDNANNNENIKFCCDLGNGKSTNNSHVSFHDVRAGHARSNIPV